MLIAPLLVGVLAAGPAWVHVPLAAFWVVGYLSFYATCLWLKSGRRERYLTPMVTYGVVAAGLGMLTLVLQPGLVRFAPLFVLPLAVGLVSSATRHERALVSGLATTLGSALVVPVAYTAGGGADPALPWLLAVVLAAYFAGTVLYVKTLIRQRGSAGYWWASVLAHAAVTLLLAPWAPAVAVVFAALTVRAALLPAFGVSPKQAGLGEVVATVAVSLTAVLTVGAT